MLTGFALSHRVRDDERGAPSNDQPAMQTPAPRGTRQASTRLPLSRVLAERSMPVPALLSRTAPTGAVCGAPGPPDPETLRRVKAAFSGRL